MSLHPTLPPLERFVHPRAKRLKLSISTHGIRLTVPPRCSEHAIANFVAQHQHWLLEHWQKLQQAQQQRTLPNQLLLSYMQAPIQLSYVALDGAFHMEHRHHFMVNNQHPEHSLTQLVIALARQVLPDRAYLYAQQQHVKLNQIRIATPRTRWGSCNRHQTIMLHAGLLLMPQDFADYVIWHELAHTRHLHHQAEFWDLLEHFYPQAKQRQSVIKRFVLPWWWQG